MIQNLKQTHSRSIWYLHFPANILLPEATDTMTPPPFFRDREQLLMIMKLPSPRMKEGPVMQELAMTISPPAAVMRILE
jgi:hypothetical protein